VGNKRPGKEFQGDLNWGLRARPTVAIRGGRQRSTLTWHLRLVDLLRHPESNDYGTDLALVASSRPGALVHFESWPPPLNARTPLGFPRTRTLNLLGVVPSAVVAWHFYMARDDALGLRRAAANVATRTMISPVAGRLRVYSIHLWLRSQRQFSTRY
jgi:hypothetical protein